MSALTLIGAAGWGISGGWLAGRPLRPRARLLATFVVASALPATALVLISSDAAAVVLGGVLAGSAARLVSDFALTQKTTSSRRQ